MICELKNKLERYVDSIIFGNNENSRVFNEINLLDFLIWVVIATLVTIFVSWWVIPLRILIWKPLTQTKYVCNKNKNNNIN